MTHTATDLEAKIQTPKERAIGRRYTIQLGASLALYAALLILALVAVPDDDPTPAQRLLAASPALGGIGIVVAYRNLFRSLDEFQQLIQLKSLAPGFGVAMVLAVGLGCAGIPGDPTVLGQAAPWIIFCGGMATWGVAARVLSTRSEA